MKSTFFYGEISIPQAKAELPNGIYLEDEIFLLEDIAAENLPSGTKEVKCLTMIFCEEGKLRYEIDGHTVIAEKNDIILYSLGQKVKNCRVLSSTFNGKAILVKGDYLSFITNHINDSQIFKKKLRETDTIKFNPEEIQRTNAFFSQIIAFMTQTGYNNRLQLSIGLIQVLFQMALDKETKKKSKKISNDLNIYNNFIEKVDEFVLLQKPITFYTKILETSCSSLEKALRKYEGLSPQEYIHLRLINRICIIAESTTRHKFPIKKIAEYTHFKSTSALSRFVKRHINMTLSEYRRKESAEQVRIIRRTILDQNAVLKALPRTYIREDLIPLLS